jgi:methyl-accepting chemotaxis protein
MEQILHKNVGHELIKTLELERLRLEAFVNGQITIVLKMADSALIRQYFMYPNDPELSEMVFDEMKAYSRALSGTPVFWVNDKDKIFYTTKHEPYIVDPENPENYWYNMTLYKTEVYNFNINYNPDLNVTNLWINAPVSYENKPLGMVGIGINLSNFLDAIYINYPRGAEFYFFNYAGEITGARNIDLVANKINIDQHLGELGKKILAYIGTLKENEVKYFDSWSEKTVAALGSIPAINWYIIAVHHFTFGEALHTGMTVLFAVMMTVIFIVFAVFNIFIIKMLKPLYHIVKELSQISIDWDLKRQTETNNKDEIKTLGEFLNMTIIDQLTGIYNRRFFDGNMKKLIKTLSRTNGKLSLLMIDIDFFKKYNDAYGHDMGDKCLKKVAIIISKSLIREEDFVARYGGEEFVVVLPNTDENGTNFIAEKLLNNIRQAKIPHKNNDIADCVTISIGGTTGMIKYSQDESDYVKCADMALYKSKQNGRNRYSFEKFITP